jgi:hypothetical protein
MIDRRDVLLGGAMLGVLPAALARAALPVPAGNRIGFDVIRKGSKLGTHVLTFDRSATGLTVHVAVDIAYKIAGITLYHYSHHATEMWAGDQVVSLQTQTDDNGDAYQVTGHREAAGLIIQGTKAPRYVAPANALPATHWNRRELDGPWINTQDGRLMRPRVTAGAIEAIANASGGTLHARHFVLTGDVQMDMWYEENGTWAGLSFAKGGAPIRYVRQG